MPRYEGRHAARHAAPKGSPRPARSGSAAGGSHRGASPSFGRPVLAGAALVATIGSAAAASQATGAVTSEPMVLTLAPAAAAAQTAEQRAVATDAARIATQRTAANTAAARTAAADQARAQARRDALARARAEAQARADRDRQRKAVLAQARTNPRAVGHQLLLEAGFDESQWQCLDQIFTHESNWDYTATNPSSGSYGIPQALPATKMASIADDWRDNPVTQIRWGIEYIRAAYGTPCNAWGLWQARRWY